MALEAAKGQRTVNEIASEFGVHSNQVSTWKQELLQAGDTVFRQPASKDQRDQEALQAELYEQIGRLKMDLEWLKKKAVAIPEH